MRSFLRKNKVLAWGAAVLLLAAGAWFLMRTGLAGAPSVREALSQQIQLRDSVSGEEFSVQRGRFEAELLVQAADGPLDVTKGALNPKTGTLTAFPVDATYWDYIVKAVNQRRPRGSPTRPAPPGQAGAPGTQPPQGK